MMAERNSRRGGHGGKDEPEFGPLRILKTSGDPPNGELQHRFSAPPMLGRSCDTIGNA
jgi:hypothetical protein